MHMASVFAACGWLLCDLWPPGGSGITQDHSLSLQRSTGGCSSFLSDSVGWTDSKLPLILAQEDAKRFLVLGLVMQWYWVWYGTSFGVCVCCVSGACVAIIADNKCSGSELEYHDKERKSSCSFVQKVNLEGCWRWKKEERKRRAWGLILRWQRLARMLVVGFLDVIRSDHSAGSKESASWQAFRPWFGLNRPSGLSD